MMIKIDHNIFIIINLATESIDEFNGPLEIFCNTHKTYLPYWKFLLEKNKTINVAKIEIAKNL